MSDINSGFDNSFRPTDTEASPRTDTLTARNRLLEERLNREGTLPYAKVYPILGASFSQADLQHSYLDGTLLPVDKAMQEKKDVCLFLGQGDNIIGSIQLTPDNGLEDKTLTIIDTHIGEQWRGQGYGQRLYLELLKALPADIEITSHSNLLPDGRRMWDRLVRAGLAEQVGNQGGKDVVGEFKTILSAPLPITAPK